MLNTSQQTQSDAHATPKELVSSGSSASDHQEQDFIGRHIGVTDTHMRKMLDVLGASSLQDVIDKTIPKALQARPEDFRSFPKALTTQQLYAHLKECAHHNKQRRPMIGMGYYRSETPPILRRLILENPSWYTSYTPYQSEISQGRLEALLIFQTMISELTGLATANASLLDEATAVLEAVMLASRVKKKEGKVILVDRQVLPNALKVLSGRAKALGWEIEIMDEDPAQLSQQRWDEAFALVWSQVGADGSLRSRDYWQHHLESRHITTIYTADPLALMALESPGSCGADIAVGSTQRFGLPLFFGGPHAGFMAVTESLRRFMPGRMVGVSRDRSGAQAYRLTLQTREQHIRRERATSNICTAQALPAIMAAMFAVHHGHSGLTAIAQHVHTLAAVMGKGLIDAGFSLKRHAWFDTVTITVSPQQGKAIRDRAEKADIDLWYNHDHSHISIAFDECADIALAQKAFNAITGTTQSLPHAADLEGEWARIPRHLRRKDVALRHEYFHHHVSETDFMRLLRRLANKDLALDRCMIPLGSCTMKLNAVVELEPVSWPTLVDIHPLAPQEASAGLRSIIDELGDMLCLISGMEKASLQPNAGAQGELAGLNAIRAYHRANNQASRDICLIPTSAHGTNPASAMCCGLKVVQVACTSSGAIDMDDLREKADQYKTRLAAAMMTYPSTFGFFEDTIAQACDIIHEHGGQVYMDGANFNALVGQSRPRDFGIDVCHFNLHKTFCIPHGGGGPGIGPIAVASHLAPFLPSDPFATLHPHEEDVVASPVAGATYGNAGVAVISYAYMRLMGIAGLQKATAVAILSANYIANRIDPYFPVLYRGSNGYVAHECIVDMRRLKKSLGLTVEDVAKRLIDYGFHAPTISWPVIETMMIEPTESEPLLELDRFIDAMISIRKEIDHIEQETWDKTNNPLVNAPHTLAEFIQDSWPYPYSREIAAAINQPFDLKYWPAVQRVDAVYGDRNVVCVCPPWKE